MKKGKSPSSQSKFYLPVEEHVDVDEKEESAPPLGTATAPQKPALPSNSKLRESSDSVDSAFPDVTLRDDRKPEEEVEMRRRHTFPKRAEETTEFEVDDSDDDGHESLESLSTLSLDNSPEGPDKHLIRRTAMLKSLRSYFKKLMDDMFPKPSDVKEIKTVPDREKSERRKARTFHTPRLKKAVSDPLKPSVSQEDFLAHLAEEMGSEYRPEEIPGLLKALGDIQFSELMNLDSGDVTVLSRSHHPELLRPSSVFVELKEEEQKKVLGAPRAESTVDDSGKMTRRLSAPAQPHKLMLLKDLFTSTPNCKVVIDEMKGSVVFEGTPEAVERTHLCFTEQLDTLFQDRRDFSKTLISIFKSPMGRIYLSEVTTAHNGCKLEVGTSFLLCAGMSRDDVRGCLTEIESDVRTNPVKVTNFSNQDLERLRKQIEEEYLARLIFQNAEDGEVLVEGLGRDVDLARGFLLRQVEEYQKDTDIFLVKGQARAKCFKNCFVNQLNEVKTIIRENKGILDERFENDRFMLTYQVRQGKMREVQMRLKIIRGNIWEATVDLKEEFPDVVDQWLLLEGFKRTDVKTFQASFERTMGEKCYVEIAITSKRWGNVTRSEAVTTVGRKKEADPARRKLNPLLNWYYTGRLTSAPFHRSIIIRNTLVTVVSGDIANITAEVLVNPIGSDLRMSGTAVGKAFLKRFGPQAQEDLSRVSLGSHHSDVIECPQTPDHLPVRALYHVILQKWPPPADTENVKTLVKTCLALAEENRCESIAFPLLGCGKKFKLPFDTVTAAMIEATRAALATTVMSLQKLTFVLSSTRDAQSFAQQLEVLTPTVPDPSEMTSELQDSGDWLLEKLATTMPKAEETSGVLLMAHLYAPSRDITNTARARLVQDLRQTFLYEDSIEHAGLLQLSQLATGEIRTAAQLESVVITRPPTGGSCLRLKGEHQAVSKVKEVVQGKLLHCLEVPAVPVTSHPSPRLGRHANYHLPAYWSTAANPTLLEEAVQNRYKLVEVSEEERAAIENLMRATWQPDLVTAGSDAAGLRHRSIDVIRVQRVENPSLFENYYNRRRALQRDKGQGGEGGGGGGSTCRQVSSLPMSSGPVLTTALLIAGSPLLREMHVDLNEHYLFHGTSAQNLQAMFRFGPDARLASAGGMLGSGIYFAESFTKSDRYADHRNHRTAGEKTVFLMRVLLGEPFINTALRPTRYLRPPCKVCKKDRCRELHRDRGGGFFDSVIDNCLSARAFRELIVYESALCYPEYAITYLRQG